MAGQLPSFDILKQRSDGRVQLAHNGMHGPTVSSQIKELRCSNVIMCADG
jgi:hypothetical protein